MLVLAPQVMTKTNLGIKIENIMSNRLWRLGIPLAHIPTPLVKIKMHLLYVNSDAKAFLTAFLF